MSNRLNFYNTAPASYKAMLQLSGYVSGTSLTHTHHDLINIRASQVNGCAFCIDMHTQEARAHGENEQRIYGLSAWDETPFYDEQERAILALTEEMTLIPNRVSDETYQRAANLFDETYLSHIMMAIVVINGWNRIAITTQQQPAVKKVAHA